MSTFRSQHTCIANIETADLILKSIGLALFHNSASEFLRTSTPYRLRPRKSPAMDDEEPALPTDGEGSSPSPERDSEAGRDERERRNASRRNGFTLKMLAVMWLLCCLAFATQYFDAHWRQITCNWKEVQQGKTIHVSDINYESRNSRTRCSATRGQRRHCTVRIRVAAEEPIVSPSMNKASCLHHLYKTRKQ